jgi:hypothetical protein
MQTEAVDARELPFEERVGQVLRGKNEESYTDAIRRMKDEGTHNYSHDYWTTGTTIEISPNSRERGHRPKIDEELYERILDSVSREYAEVPVRSLSFDQVVRMGLDKAERYYNILDCGLEEDS